MPRLFRGEKLRSRRPYLIFKAHLSMVGNNAPSQMETSMSIFDLSGRVAVITGGNGGIGLGIAQALATAGCNVSIWARNAEKNKSAAATMAGGAGKRQTK